MGYRMEGATLFERLRGSYEKLDTLGRKFGAAGIRLPHALPA
jgi:hypothetical protein